MGSSLKGWVPAIRLCRVHCPCPCPLGCLPFSTCFSYPEITAMHLLIRGGRGGRSIPPILFLCCWKHEQETSCVATWTSHPQAQFEQDASLTPHRNGNRAQLSVLPFREVFLLAGEKPQSGQEEPAHRGLAPRSACLSAWRRGRSQRWCRGRSQRWCRENGAAGGTLYF